MREKGCCKSPYSQVILVLQVVLICGKGIEIFCRSFQGSGSGCRGVYKESVRKCFRPSSLFYVHLFHERTHCFFVSAPLPGPIGGIPLGIGATISRLRVLRDPTTQGTPQGGGEGELPANMLSSFSYVNGGDFSRESSTGGIEIGTRDRRGVINQDYTGVSTRFSDLVQDARTDTTVGDSMPTVMLNSSSQVFDRLPPANRFSVIHQEEPYSTLPAIVGARSPSLRSEGRPEVLQPVFAPALSGFMGRIKEGMSPGILPTSQNGVPSPLLMRASYRTPYAPARKLASLKSCNEDKVVSILYHDNTNAIYMGFVGTNG